MVKKKLIKKLYAKLKKVSKQSLNLTEENLEHLKKLFPSVFSEGKIDFEKLKILLGNEIDDKIEKYNFGWAGKSNVFRNIQTTAKGTLILDKEDSVDFDKTGNLFIEGDNLEVLKLLQKSYQNKVKMIYIDPPYNTGKDFVYKDNFKDSIRNYEKITGQIDEDGNRTDTNKETNGRFHSDWLTMMYPRLYLAKNLLKDDGVIFVSIDDHEVHNLRKIMDDIFGEENFVSQLVWKGRSGAEDDDKYRRVHEYILVFSKSDIFNAGLDIKEDEKFPYFDEEKNKNYKTQLLRKWGDNSKREDRPNLFYSISGPDNKKFYPKLPNSKDGCWRWDKKKMEKEISLENIEFRKNKKNAWEAYEKIYEPKNGEKNNKKFNTWLDEDGNSSRGTKECKIFFDEEKLFDRPKSTKLLKKLMNMADFDSNDIILDFFAGSGTTAHAVLDLNKEDGRNRKFICVQLPEKTDEKSEAFKAGYKTIAEISKERIRRVIKKIKEENSEEVEKMDLGFKVFKLAKSNYKIWEDYEGKDEKELLKQLELFQSPLIAGYKKIDLIYEILIKEGYDLNSNIEEVEGVKTNKVFRVGNGERFFYVCLDEKIKTETIKDLKLNKETMFVCLDDSLDDNQKINLSLKINLRSV